MITKKKTITLGVISILFFLFQPGIVQAQAPSETKGTVIFDFTREKEGDGPMAYVIMGRRFDDIVRKVGMSPEDVRGKDKEKLAFLEKLREKGSKITNNRLLGKKGDKFEIYLFYKGMVEPELDIQEKKRKSGIVKDIMTLSKLLFTTLAKGGDVIQMTSRTFQLSLERAVVSIKAKLDKKERNVEIITGSSEHWFFSADLLLQKLAEVKIVSAKDKESLEPRETPKEFHLGLNWMIGDIFNEKRGLLKNLFLKGMVKFSKSPLDSYGFGVGFRFPGIKILGVDLSSFSIFSSVIWSKEQSEDKQQKLKKRQILFGISYNLDKALGWSK